MGAAALKLVETPDRSETLTDVSAAAAYNPKLHWNVTAQPEQGFRPKDYCQIAEHAQNDLIAQQEEFYRANDFRVITISHDDFLNYEEGMVPFSKWLDAHCEKHNLNRNADICLVGPSLKTLTSAQRKTETNSPTPDRVVDYLRCMPIVLKKSPLCPKNRASLTILDRLIKTIEQDPKTLAHKNYFWNPHPATEMQGYKTLWQCTVPNDNKDWGNFEILAEVKIEHEAQMDIDRLTRKFLNYGRETKTAMTQIYNNSCCSAASSSQTHKWAEKTSRAMNNREKMIRRWGKMLYRRVNHDAGFTRFLNPAGQAPTPLSMKEILERIEMDLSTMKLGQQVDLRKNLCASGLFPKNSSLGCEMLSRERGLFTAKAVFTSNTPT